MNFQIAPAVPEVFKILEHEKAENCLKYLTELLHCLMALHPGFPELYDPILDVIQVANIHVISAVYYKKVGNYHHIIILHVY